MEQENIKQKSPKEKKIPYKAKCSLLGKTAKIVPCEDRVEIYTTGTWLIILSLWVFAAAAFALTFFIFNNYFVWLFAALFGGICGYLLAAKLYLGKLTKTFLYDEIECIISDVPELTIIHDDQKMFVLKALTADCRDFDLALNEALKNSKYQVKKTNDRFYIKLK